MKADDHATIAPEELPFEPLEGSSAGNASVFHCPLCGSRFTHGQQACPSCPVNAGCSLVTCPNCSYSFPRSSRLVDWAKRLLGRQP
jgi:hypothetical protein